MKRVVVEKKILERNEKSAEKIRKILKDNGVFALNFMSSPGAGKTTTVEKTIEELKDDYEISFIDGDLETDWDAERIKALVRLIEPRTILAVILITVFFYLLFDLPALMRFLLGKENKGLTGENETALFQKKATSTT